MNNILLTGFPGTGKTVVAQEAARLLGWAFMDTDLEVERRAGKSVAAIFTDDGESAFRALEAEALRDACAERDMVIATGGGAFIDPSNRELMLRSGLVVALEATPETIGERLFHGGGNGHGHANRPPAERPLFRGADPMERVRGLKASRQADYAHAHWTVHTTGLTVAEAAQEVVRAWSLLRERAAAASELAATVHSSSGPCPVYVGPGLLERLGELCRAAGLTTTAYLFSDPAVSGRHGRRAQLSLERAGIAVHTLTLPQGETTKGLDTLSECYGWLADRRAERGHFIVALGGGVIGDLAGFVAATFNRGMPVVQAPTSLAAMVDAAIGGKTAINLPQGKNLVGAFHQPRLVVADIDTLATLPARELTSGWAEAIKHGLILDSALLETFEERADEIARLEQPVTTEVVRRSVAIKARVVTQDERETLGLRMMLNYGHTVGHALEAATEYGRLLHGEAVAIGMTAAARISQAMGLLDGAAVERQDRLLARFGLPTHFPEADRDAVRRAMLTDKKTTDGSVRWVLLEGVGQAVVRRDVPREIVDAALDDILL